LDFRVDREKVLFERKLPSWLEQKSGRMALEEKVASNAEKT
jgi:hypothetical protein